MDVMIVATLEQQQILGPFKSTPIVGGISAMESGWDCLELFVLHALFYGQRWSQRAPNQKRLHRGNPTQPCRLPSCSSRWEWEEIPETRLHQLQRGKKSACAFLKKIQLSPVMWCVGQEWLLPGQLCACAYAMVN
nr:basic leucine zipper transcriptional factor ATF-like 3 isoform X1 [Pelodiscus sinensis]|eukprot:XP_025042175.1 basic leucine zipper transcriptional factor ATF-like 3 isoform X1 [Pelodiscus sinensis]